MDFLSASRRRRAPLAAAILLGAAAAATAASLGGGYWAASGPGRVTLKRDTASPVEFPGNFRLDFDGEPGDAAGSGTVVAYDAAGAQPIGEFPFTWVTKRGAAFRADFAGGEFEEFLADRIEESAGGEVSVALTAATGKGKLNPRDETLRLTVKARGEAVRDGGPARKLRLKVKLR